MSKCLAEVLEVKDDLIEQLIDHIARELLHSDYDSCIAGSYLLGGLLDQFGIEYELKTGRVTIGGNRGRMKEDAYWIWIEIDEKICDTGRRMHEICTGSRVRYRYDCKSAAKNDEEEYIKSMVDAIGREYDIFWVGVDQKAIDFKNRVEERARSLYLLLLESAVPE